MKTAENRQLSSTLTSERLHFLDSLRAVAIIMVIGVHSLGYCVKLPQNQEEIVSFVVHTVSVPVFFLVDGFLLAYKIVHSERFDYFDYVRKNLFRLLVPWTIFTAIYTLTRYAFELTGFLKVKLIVGHSLQQILISAYGSVYAPQMYFLFSLFLIRLCSPIFKKIILIKSILPVFLLFVTYYIAFKASITSAISYLIIEGGQEPLLHALWGMQFYFFGVVLFKLSKMIDLKRLFWPFMAFFSFVFLIGFRLNIDDLERLTQYLCLIVFFLFFTFLPNKLPFLSVIGKNTMGIYLIHAPIVLKGVSLALKKFLFDPLLSFVSILLITFVLSFCIVKFINTLPFGFWLFGEPYKKYSIHE